MLISNRDKVLGRKSNKLMGSAGRPPSDTSTRNGPSEEVKFELRFELQEGARHRLRGANAKTLRQVLGAPSAPWRPVRAREDQCEQQESKETGRRAGRGQFLKDLVGEAKVKSLDFILSALRSQGNTFSQGNYVIWLL